MLTSINYTGGVFDNPSLVWTQSAYIQAQIHPYDRFFFDEVSGNYTVDRFLADLEKRYGGVDAILLWPSYTNLGIDDRNQFDFLRTMPGGLDGVKQVMARLQANGVRVLWPYNPWDTGTRREALDDQHTLAALLKQTGGDGFNGDTMGSVPRSFWAAALQDSYPLAFEPEDGGTDSSLGWSTMGWGYWLYPHAPQVDRFKFLTRGKFLTNVCDRWATRKTDNLQSAWFNGAGYEAWENVWGTWNGIVPRDAEAIRRVGTMLRFFGGEGGLLQAAEWEPHTPDVRTPGVFGSRFPNGVPTPRPRPAHAPTLTSANLLPCPRPCSPPTPLPFVRLPRSRPCQAHTRSTRWSTAPERAWPRHSSACPRRRCPPRRVERRAERRLERRRATSTATVASSSRRAPRRHRPAPPPRRHAPRTG